MKFFRQGDVGIKQITKLPDGAKAIKSEQDRVVLAYGEVTGHAHALPVKTVQMYEVGNDRYIEVTNPSDLRHEEHDPITLEPGFYQIIQQREYTPQEIRRVVD